MRLAGWLSPPPPPPPTHGGNIGGYRPAHARRSLRETVVGRGGAGRGGHHHRPPPATPPEPVHLNRNTHRTAPHRSAVSSRVQAGRLHSPLPPLLIFHSIRAFSFPLPCPALPCPSLPFPSLPFPSLPLGRARHKPRRISIQFRRRGIEP